MAQSQKRSAVFDLITNPTRGEAPRAVRDYRVFAASGPITESEFQRRHEEARNELLPVAELANELAGVVIAVEYRSRSEDTFWLGAAGTDV